jgi:BASS family bile acid:Na+ symporter
MLAGLLIYLAFANLSFLDPLKSLVRTVDEYLTPTLIFMQLLITFCKVNPKEFRLRRWHLWLVVIQLVVASVT